MMLRIAAFVLTVSHIVNSISASASSSVAVAHSAVPDGHYSVAYLGRNLKDDSKKCGKLTCTAGTGFIDCVNGYVDHPTNSKTCQQACTDAGGSCCSGSGGGDACVGFSGRICPDGSCGGSAACQSATIGCVVNSCFDNQACYRANIGSALNSCGFPLSCQIQNSQTPGSIASISDGCNARASCQNVGGSIGKIESSCNFDFSCQEMAKDGGDINKVRSLSKSSTMIERQFFRLFLILFDWHISSLICFCSSLLILRFESSLILLLVGER